MLALVGATMLMSDWQKMSVGWAFGVIVLLLSASIVASRLAYPHAVKDPIAL
jgi:hypothetical protein